MRAAVALLSARVVGSAVLGPAAAQHASPAAPGRLRPARGITRRQAEEILFELRQLRAMLARQNVLLERLLRPVGAAPGAARTVRLPLAAGEAQMGPPAAPVTLVEFTDLQCKFCRRFARRTFPAIEERYIATGRVQFISRDLPLRIHRYAMGAAEAARCAGAQGKYWEFRAAVLRMSGPPTPQALDGIARGLGLGLARFGACLRSRRYASAVRADLAAAQRLGIRGVPAFVVGRVIGAWVVGRVIVGAKPLAIFERAIGRAAAATGSAR